MEEKSQAGDVKNPPEMEEKVVGRSQPIKTEEEAAKEKDPASSHDLPNNSNGTRKIMPTQLTIFYAGSVSVFDAVTAEKVRELMLIAAADAANKTADVKNGGTSGPPSPLVCTGSSSLQNSAPGSPVVQPYPDQKSSICKLQAEFPIARRHSLQRFLEKRRDRLVSKNPYPTSPATQVDDDAKINLSNNASPGLGCFKQSSMVKEEIQPSSATAYPA